MPVEEKGEADVIITKAFIEQERKKLEELKRIQAEKQQITKAPISARVEPGQVKSSDKQIKKLEKKIKDLEKTFKKEQVEKDNALKKSLSKAGAFLSDPKEFFAERVFDVLKTTRAIPIIGAILGFGGTLFKLIEKEFGDGGIFDLRVRVHDIVRSIVGLKQLMDIEAGEIFMSADTRLNTYPPETSNTESLRDGHVRFNQLTLGYE